MRRRINSTCSLTALLLLVLTPGIAGCVHGIAGMVVKHVAMSAAKKVAVDTYKHYKEEKHAAERDRANSEPDSDRGVATRDDVGTDSER